ncbi:glycosyltransferase family 4 protein [Cupriavidus lacunae]|uniref:Glycosyl transferase n=1 Tax=Cupriavidus lacunae TaxID=2666307 RepID=A0A370NZ13_9BURK|nr:glycosyltransferase family 4 protein [Cupriavidus lacunae]RDK10879.1 glycosyl transferase [Cupriavidus lacunae]
MKVLVTHPGLQHSHQMAQALYEQGLLRQYWSGVPVRGPGEPVPWWLPPAYGAKVREVGIPEALRRHPLCFPAMLKLGLHRRIGLNRYLGMSHSAYAHRVFHLFDAWAARRIEALRPDVVVAYENSAMLTFEAARRIGARCVLDAPAVHRVAAAAMMDLPPDRYQAQIDARKDREVELSDLVITCSEFAAQSYADAGVPSSKLRPILLGASPPGNVRRRRTRAGTRFLFAGGLTTLKAVDLLQQAFAMVRARVPEAELAIAGWSAEPGLAAALASTPGVTLLGALPQPVLYQEIADADCLVLPSRFDSFGMVVAEALACGTPALVSERVGAKEILQEFPRAGWIVQVSAQSLYDRMLELATVRASLDEARQYASLAGEKYTWARYRSAAVATIATLC